MASSPRRRSLRDSLRKHPRARKAAIATFLAFGGLYVFFDSAYPVWRQDDLTAVIDLLVGLAMALLGLALFLRLVNNLGGDKKDAQDVRVACIGDCCSQHSLASRHRSSMLSSKNGVGTIVSTLVVIAVSAIALYMVLARAEAKQ